MGPTEARVQPSPALMFAFLGVASAGVAETVSPPPSPPARASTWACTRETLLDGQPCTLEGSSPPLVGAARQAGAAAQAAENRRGASALAEELCSLIARADASEPNAAALSSCRSRVPAAVRACGGSGARRLLDEAGRFNPGFGRCYAGIAELVRGAEESRELAEGCCACAQASCGASAGQCLTNAAAGRSLGSCVEGRCRAECAAALLVRSGPMAASPRGAVGRAP